MDVKDSSHASRPACPVCGGAETLKFAYGLVEYEFFTTSDENGLIPGGCCVMEDSPDFRCSACGFEWQHPDFWSRS